MISEKTVPEIVMLSEVNQKQKNKYHTVIQKWGIQKSGIHDLIHKAETEAQCT